MADGGVSFDLRQLDAVSNNVLSVAALTDDKRSKLLKSIGVEMEAQTTERFDTKTDPQGNKWKDIADTTKSYYNAMLDSGKTDGKPRPPLVFTGDLRMSVTSEVQGGGWSVIVGAAKEYANVHQYGFEAKNIPARPFIGISAENQREIEEIIRAYLRRMFK
ncbi:MAG: phage virion morphogenesis protein [Treponema sp.]|jgi:phage virion morphogenesis protein|nr:phage virion morphogenesis protein [Treponema sp.]